MEVFANSSQTTDHLQRAIDMVGLARLAKALGVTYQAVRKWQAAGRLPRTEWTGETRYADRIEQATSGAVTRADLLTPWPISNKGAAPLRDAA